MRGWGGKERGTLNGPRSRAFPEVEVIAAHQVLTARRTHRRGNTCIGGRAARAHWVRTRFTHLLARLWAVLEANTDAEFARLLNHILATKLFLVQTVSALTTILGPTALAFFAATFLAIN